MMAGTAGFLPRDASRSHFVRVVRANGKGYLLHIPEVAARSLQFMRYNKRLIDVNRLTNRERQVLILVADGMKNAGIANELGISPPTPFATSLPGFLPSSKPQTGPTLAPTLP